MTELIPIPSPGVPLVYGEIGAPAVVVVHDDFGRLPWLQPFAESLAGRAGLRVIVPDLYDGVATHDPREADELVVQLAAEPVRDAVIAELRSATESGSERVGIVGFSAGGTLALKIAQAGEVDAVVAYYATLTAAQQSIIPCPVLLQFAERDDWPETGSPEQFVGRLRENGTPVTQHGYAGTVRGFANASIPAVIDTRAAALAFARTTLFLETHVGE
ncbi:MAG TPA: dienelactone hydrolase family protein [Pseudolysinimonas sp.]